MIDAKRLESPPSSLGPAMHFVIALAAQRARERSGATLWFKESGPIAALWELVERYHPEEVWLAESCLLGERSLDELARTAPRGALAPAVLAAAESSVIAPPRQHPSYYIPAARSSARLAPVLA